MTSLYVALVHHPIVDRSGEVVTTAVTNLDVHDIARSCRTYGVDAYHVVTPLTSQRQIVERILEHWLTGPGTRRLPQRGEALAICSASESIEAVVQQITEREGQAPRLWVTSARAGSDMLSWNDAQRELKTDGAPRLILFGTGHGLAPQVMEAADDRLPPVRPGVYNHLSVRSAVAIVLDRLLGDA